MNTRIAPVPVQAGPLPRAFVFCLTRLLDQPFSGCIMMVAPKTPSGACLSAIDCLVPDEEELLVIVHLVIINLHL